MLAILCVLLSILVGWSAVRLMPLSIRRLEALSMSVAIGFPVVGWLVFLAASFFGFAIGLPLALLITAGLCSPIFFIQSKLNFNTKPYSKKFRVLAWLLALTIAFLVGRLVFLSYQFPGVDGAWYSNGNAWGDGPLHVAYANQFSQGNTVDLVSPSYLKVPLTYPFIADFYTAILLRLGGGWTLSFLAPSLIMLLALIYLVFSFGYRLLGSARAAWFQLLFLVFSGAVQGGWKLTQVLLQQGISGYHAFIGTSIPFSTGDNYLNFIHSHPIPQRAYLFGMPLLIVILTLALEQYRNHSQKAWIRLRDLSSRRSLSALFATPAARREWLKGGSAFAVLCIGMLPLVHVHSFLVFIGLAGLACLGLLISRRSLPKAWMTSLVGGLLLAAPQIIWQVRSSYDNHFSRWIAGWNMRNFSLVTDGNLFTFWLSQIGILLIVMIGGWWVLRRAKAPAPLWLFYIAGIGIFLICNVYVFQPSVWDNMKFFEYAFWFEMLITGYILAHWSRQLWQWLLVVPVVLSLTIMGFYTLALSGPELTFPILSKDEVAFAEHMRIALPQNSYLLVSDRHNNPITMLSGHKVMMTYSGWYNLYNSMWPLVLQDRTTMIMGGDQAEMLIEEYGITHAAFSDAEITNKEANLTYFQNHYKLVTHEGGWWVFDTSLYKATE